MLSIKNLKLNKSERIIKNIIYYIVLHGCIWLYSLVSILNKVSASYSFLSVEYIGLFTAMIFILLIYAFLWQQIIKKFKISVAYCSKNVTIIWATIYAVVIFGETITPRILVGIGMIVIGLIVISYRSGKEEDE